ncbi:MAG: hypothetical protein HY825_01385, partial [Acidobacteria bacterium]|nr:hypothetical protein [Acidobacteriota bacterium]
MSGQPRSVSAELGFDLSQLDAAVLGAAPQPAAAEPPARTPRRRVREGA